MKNLTVPALRLAGWIDQLQPVLLLVLRCYLAWIFFKSGLVKIADWESTLDLFRYEYQVPILPPMLAAIAGTVGELVFPVLLALGLAGRLGALGLFFVNLMAVIAYPALFEFECPAAVNDHFFWGTLLLVPFVFGPGKLSLDHWLYRRQAG